MEIDVSEKTCSRCGEIRPLDAFNRYRHSQDGRQNYCRDCQRAYRQAPERMAAEREREKSPERLAYKNARMKTPAGRAANNRRQAIYRERHAEELAAKRQTEEWKAYQRKWKREHREAVRAYMYAYVRTPEYREAQRIRSRTPKRIVWRQAYQITPEYRARQAEYRDSHREEFRLYRQRPEVKEAARKRGRRYNQSPKGIAARLAYRRTPEYQERMREYSRVYEITHKEARRAQRRTPERRAYYRIRAHKRRTLGEIPAGWWNARLTAQEGRCCYCKKPFNQTSRKATIEHIVPVSRGGANDIGNLAIACKRCNSRRGNRRVLAPVSGMLLL